MYTPNASPIDDSSSNDSSSSEGMMVNDNDCVGYGSVHGSNVYLEQHIILVQFRKHSEEALGITLRLNCENQCIVARVMYGGLIHKNELLKIGDEICSINNMDVNGHSVIELQRILKDIDGEVVLKIKPSHRQSNNKCEIFMRSMFAYDPLEDDLIPCSEAGICFEIGDILHIISKDDPNWWQAQKLGYEVEQQAGLIPSPELQEWRVAHAANLNDKRNKCSSMRCKWFNRKKKCNEKNLGALNQLCNIGNFPTYEEVVNLPYFYRKTLIFLGAHGVGRRQIKNILIQMYPDRFASPIPHTTRKFRPNEENGRDYFFVTHEQMMADIAANKYLEYGTHEDAMYGIKIDTVFSIHTAGQIAVLDVEPLLLGTEKNALTVLRKAEYSPFIAFIAAPCFSSIEEDNESLEHLVTESQKLEEHYGCMCDIKIINNDMNETVQILIHAMDNLISTPQWIPISWVY